MIAAQPLLVISDTGLYDYTFYPQEVLAFCLAVILSISFYQENDLLCSSRGMNEIDPRSRSQLISRCG